MESKLNQNSIGQKGRKIHRRVILAFPSLWKTSILYYSTESEVVEKEIENDRLTYEEFINVFIEVFQQNVPEEADESTVEVREELVNKICQSIIDKYEQGNEEWL